MLFAGIVAKGLGRIRTLQSEKKHRVEKVDFLNCAVVPAPLLSYIYFLID